MPPASTATEFISFQWSDGQHLLFNWIRQEIKLGSWVSVPLPLIVIFSSANLKSNHCLVLTYIYVKHRVGKSILLGVRL